MPVTSARRAKTELAAGSIEELSYDVTSGALAEQERALAALRVRAGTVIAAASVSSSFLATKAADGSIDLWGWLALGLFVCCLGSSLAVLLPYEFDFGFSGQVLLGESDQRGVDDVEQGYRALTLWLEPSLTKNRDRIELLSRWFALSCVLLAAEVVIWVISIAS